MSMTIDQKLTMKAYLSRKIRTFPILVIMIFSLLPLGTYTYEWVRGKTIWHQTEAEVFMVNEDGGAFYKYRAGKEGTRYDRTMPQYKILLYYPVGKKAQVHDILQIAYDREDPGNPVVFYQLQLRMMTWAAVFVICFILYFWLEWELKKRAKIRIAG